jgi:hypothetical protein
MHVDYYMPEEERDELVEKFLADEYAQYEKRLKVRDDADFVLESLGLIRKDLVHLDSNEDAIDLHQDMAGISRVCLPSNLLSLSLSLSVSGPLSLSRTRPLSQVHTLLLSLASSKFLLRYLQPYPGVSYVSLSPSTSSVLM